ncbi:hypothetical protein BOTBODRAFT_182414 [Botryobasidium botryosum FD-172 SS1]|uniref:Uncharacterized protein n=1 Tax=Botryobasidium botryosum (strain FD-172 SS1) TaxID=930990 RepID=A0A067M1W0_BOTB1|nr:hypothetical protein BOTBODRAFT_182414 [Botryobasidium botryosum FD-172 SS1]
MHSSFSVITTWFPLAWFGIATPFTGLFYFCVRQFWLGKAAASSAPADLGKDAQTTYADTAVQTAPLVEVDLNRDSSAVTAATDDSSTAGSDTITPGSAESVDQTRDAEVQTDLDVYEVHEVEVATQTDPPITTEAEIGIQTDSIDASPEIQTALDPQPQYAEVSIGIDTQYAD